MVDHILAEYNKENYEKDDKEYNKENYEKDDKEDNEEENEENEEYYNNQEYDEEDNEEDNEENNKFDAIFLNKINNNNDRGNTNIIFDGNNNNIIFEGNNTDNTSSEIINENILTNIKLDLLIIDYLKELNKHYPECLHDNGMLKNDYSGHKITYGEMDIQGIDVIFDIFKDKNFDTFIDIGSGRGKLCLYVLKYKSITKSFGIELVEERHNDALILKEKLSVYDITNKANFINDDFLNFNLSELKNTQKKILIWISNLCFDHDITDKIFVKIIDELPKGTIICCSKPYNFDSDKIKTITNIVVKMSWSDSSSIYCYEIQ